MAADARSTHFGHLLRQHRLAAGLSQQQLAERAGLSRRGIADLERGNRRAPHPSTLRSLVEALALDQADLPALVAAARVIAAPNEPVGACGAQVPVLLTTFVGREREVATVLGLLETSRLVTLTGSGGIGKTRLAIHIGTQLRTEQHADVSVVELAALADAARVAETVASQLGIREQPGQNTADVLATALGSRRMLLVLDNCEHLLLTCAQFADHLLRTCPELRILATSREALRIGGETIWRVPPLSTPSNRETRTDHQIGDYEAVRLFVERANAAAPPFELRDNNSKCVAELCARLDGVPLAIELAAARVPALGLEDLVSRLDDSLRLLTGGSRTALPRQQTLRSTLDWSYGLLTEPERMLFRRVAVFASVWTLPAAEKVCSGGGIADSDVLDLLTALVAQSLVLVERVAGETRYRMLETVRQYAAEKLDTSADACALRHRHLVWFMNRAEALESSLDGPDQAVLLERMEATVDNLRAALWWAKRQSAHREAGLRLAAALGVFWWRRGHAQEGGEHLEELLTVSEDCERDELLYARAKGLTAAGFLRLRRGSPVAARPLLEEALGIARRLQHADLIGVALTYLGEAANRERNPAAARPLLEEALALARHTGGWLRWYIVLNHLAAIAAADGEAHRARALYGECLAEARLRQDTHCVGLVLHRLGSLELDQGDLSSARRYLRESLVTFHSTSTSEVPQVLAGFVGLAAAESQPLRALRLAAGTHALRRAQGAVLQPSERARLEEQLARAGAAVDERTARQAWADGEKMTLDELVEYTLQPARDASNPAACTSRSRQGGLSARECEVAQLIARGLTNRQIAEALVISERTAARHVENILTKLVLPNRTQVARWAVERGLDMAQ
jgi:non-specific serine/threonine protein kinase